MSVSKRQLEIMQHALGLDQYGQGAMYRNHFCAGGDTETVCRELVAMGLMKQHATTDLFPDFNCSVTEAGIAAVREHSPKPPKKTRSQLRYERFMSWNDAFGGTFREFLEYEKQ